MIVAPCLFFQEVHGNSFPIWGHRAPLPQNDLQDRGIHLQRLVGDNSNLLRTEPGKEGFVFQAVFANGSYILQIVCQPLKRIGCGAGIFMFLYRVGLIRHDLTKCQELYTTNLKPKQLDFM